MTSRSTRWRHEKFGPPAPRTLAPCGTYAAAWRHRRRGEPLDPACAEALWKYQAERQRARRQAKEEG